jgi:lysozyme family protein
MAKAPKNFAQVARGYANLWKKAELTKRKEALAVADRILKVLDRYTPVTKETGVPEWAIGILHYREGNLNFSTYLGNGQPLKQRTTIVPKGRGPFASFTEGAIDAIRQEGIAGIKDWSAARFLYISEKYNGFGYFMKGLNSPYVWGGTTLQQPGKYVRDGQFDRSVMDTQLGSAAILKALCERSPIINNQVNKVDVEKAIESGKTAAQIVKERDMTTETKTETVDVKSPIESKINWTQLVAVVASLGVVFGLNISPEMQATIVTGITFAQGALTFLFRTFGKQTAVSTGKV